MDTKIYFTGLLLMVSWMVINYTTTRFYKYVTNRQIRKLLDELEEKQATRKKKTAKKK